LVSFAGWQVAHSTPTCHAAIDGQAGRPGRVAPAPSAQATAREFRVWAAMDPSRDNSGCTIRVSRRPGSLVRPPAAQPLLGLQAAQPPLGLQEQALARSAGF